MCKELLESGGRVSLDQRAKGGRIPDSERRRVFVRDETCLATPSQRKADVSTAEFQYQGEACIVSGITRDHICSSSLPLISTFLDSDGLARAEAEMRMRKFGTNELFIPIITVHSILD